MNRRNLLIGIGTAAVGSGAVLGSGALTQVSADRTATVNTADDSSAIIELGIPSGAPNVVTDGSTSTNGNNGQSIIDINLSNLNDNATTTLSPVFSIENGLDSAVGVKVTSSASGGVSIRTVGDGTSLTSDYYNLDASDTNTDGGTDYIEVELEIDTSTVTSGDITLTIEADTSQSA